MESLIFTAETNHEGQKVPHVDFHQTFKYIEKGFYILKSFFGELFLYMLSQSKKKVCVQYRLLIVNLISKKQNSEP